MVYGVLLKPLPFVEPDRLVGMWHTAPELGFDVFEQSPATYFTYRDENRVFEDGTFVEGENLPGSDGILVINHVPGRCTGFRSC